MTHLPTFIVRTLLAIAFIACAGFVHANGFGPCDSHVAHQHAHKGHAAHDAAQAPSVEQTVCDATEGDCAHNCMTGCTPLCAAQCAVSAALAHEVPAAEPAYAIEAVPAMQVRMAPAYRPPTQPFRPPIA